MKTGHEFFWSGLVIGVVAGGVMVGMINIIVGRELPSKVSRRTQQCIVIGEDLGCQSASTRYSYDECSCLVGGRRVAFEHEWEGRR